MVTRNETRGGFPWRVVFVGALLYLCVHWLLVGQAEIGGSSEAREAHIISVIANQGTWELPLRNGIIPSKPPLFHWIGAAISLTVGGVSELTVRAPSVLGAFVAIVCAMVCTFRLARSFDESWRPVRPRDSALIAGGVLSLTYGFHQMACQAMVDMIFTACVWGALACLSMTDRELWASRRCVSRWSGSGFWFFCSLAVLARGPLGLVLPVLMAGTTAVFLVGLRNACRLFVTPQVGWLALLIPLGWYYLAYQEGGMPFVERQLLFENVKRLTGGDNVNTESWWFYGPSLLRTTFPWGILALGGGVAELLRNRSRIRGTREVEAIALPLLCLGVGTVLLSIASGKRHSYLLPLMPFVSVEVAVLYAVLSARAVSTWRGRAVVAVDRCTRMGRMVSLALVGGMALFAGGWIDIGPLTATVAAELLHILPPVAVALLLVGIAASVFIPKQLVGRPAFSLWGVLFPLMAAVVATGGALKASFKGFPAMALELRRVAGPEAEIVVIKDSYDEYFDPILYYVGRPVAIKKPVPGSFVCQSSTVYVTHSKWLEKLASTEAVEVRVLGTLREHRAQLHGLNSRDVVIFSCVRGAQTSLQPVRWERL